MKYYLSLAAFFLSVGLALLPSAAQATGVHVSGGGTGVMVGSKVYLLDLIEAGIRDNQTKSPPNKTLLQPLAYLPWLGTEEKQILASKLNLLYHIDPILGTATVKAILNYNWALTPEELTPLPVDQPIVQDANLKQVAVRKTLEIYVSQNLWNHMPAYHRAALIMHEALSALLPPSEPEVWARQLTAAIFSYQAGTQLAPLLIQEISNSWPSTFTLPVPFEADNGSGIGVVSAMGSAIAGTPQPTWDMTIYPYIVDGPKIFTPADRFVNPLIATTLCSLNGTAKLSITLMAYNLALSRLDGDSSVEPHLKASLAPATMDVRFVSQDLENVYAQGEATPQDQATCEKQITATQQLWNVYLQRLELP